MPVKKLKNELAKLIAETDDEALLSMVKEDIAFYKTAKTTDILDGLSEKQLKELDQLTSEPPEKDTVSLKGFKKATDKWRTK